jgi:hypothetical protein
MDSYSLNDLIDLGFSNLYLKIAEENGIDLPSLVPLNADGSKKAYIPKEFLKELKEYILSLR